jgi:hypothetical protein
VQVVQHEDHRCAVFAQHAGELAWQLLHVLLDGHPSKRGGPAVCEERGERGGYRGPERPHVVLSGTEGDPPHGPARPGFGQP